ncbi:hypothetical protein AVEN_154018-1 [Araneus ventricosus]|uniref:DDE-1 domain-containing protein n=1 Tax=Araneus ventricosus TaxID=182803 RepID=A0A4Y2JX39_ARAVE|nr:hypothetical protein AVEN_191794-1 [Araneus ventricosus]GBM94943.1 hypothetical protein AVEN_154018-1 [Araneus ventricosus]
MRLEVENVIDEFEEDHGQELIIEELTELHCVPQQEVVDESLSDEEVTAEQQSSGTIKERPKVWKTLASNIEKHHLNKAVAVLATNLFNYNTVSYFR